MDFESHAYRLIGTLPIFVVLLIGLGCCFQQRWRNYRVCSLVGIALFLALGMRVIMPFVMQVLIQILIDRGGPGLLRGPLLTIVPTFVYSAASAVIWGLVLWAIFGEGGVVRSAPRHDDMYD